MREPTRPEPLRGSLDRLLRSLGAGTSSTVTELLACWPEVAGVDLALHCTVASLRDRALVLEVDDPAWASHVRWQEAALIERIGDVIDEEVVSIEVRVRRRSTRGLADPDR